MALDADCLQEDLQERTGERLGLENARARAAKRRAVHRAALALLLVMRHLTGAQRRQILEHALQVNEA